jgi:ABC-2 type transport system ATP-binding protein
VSAAPAIEARGLAKRFGEKVAVRPFEARLLPGEITGLLGPNGSGKSTFLRMLLGLVRPDGGAASVAGVPLRGDGTAIRRRSTYMPGETALYHELSGARHLAWLLRGRGAAALARARAIATDLRLPLEQRVRGYSHGMKRLLLFAASLAPDVPVRILDEPTEGLDPSMRARVLDRLAADAARGTCVLLSSHHLGEVDRACARILCLNAGALLADERADALRERARRLLRLSFEPGVDAQALAPRLAALGAEEVRAQGSSATARLGSGDPRPFLAALGGARDLPPLSAAAFGELSLSELYRELYGVEGV